MFVSGNLDKKQRNEIKKSKKKQRLKFFQGSDTVLWKMANFEEERVKLTNAQVIKLKLSAKITQEQYYQ